MSIAPKKYLRYGMNLVGAALVISLCLYGVGVGREKAPATPDPLATTPVLPAPPESIRTTAAAPMPKVSPRAPASTSRVPTVPAAAVARFQSKFGTDLKVQLTRDGRLESARGIPGSGIRATTDFRPDDPQKAIARAREVLGAAREAMGVRDDFPLGNPVARSSATSAQVFFRETVGGVPIAPGGNVTVDLGPQGELLGLYSDYAPGVHVTNERTRTADELQATAISAVPGVVSAIKPSAGNAVVWVVGKGPEAEGRHAYEYQVKGHQVVVDASSGEILRRRDQRDF